jgi:hypothetical protein
MRNTALKTSATSVPKASALLKNGRTPAGNPAKNAGNTSIETAATSATPMTRARRASSIRELMISMPLTRMNAAVKRSAAPITGLGISAIAMATLGKNASTAKMPPMAQATRRLETPVAVVKPRLDAEGFIPMLPNRPAPTVARPSASTPPLTERMFGRTHPASFSFW